MSYFLLHEGTLAASSPLIKAHERQAFIDAAALLEHSRNADIALKTAQQAAEEEGFAAGKAAGLAEVETFLANEIAHFAQLVEQIKAEHQAAIAQNAYAAAAAIIGSFDADELVERVARQIISRRDEGEGLQVQVAPQMQARLMAAFQDKPAISIMGDPAMEPTDCVVIAANGRIIGNVSLQLEKLASRWGLDSQSIDEAAL